MEEYLKASQAAKILGVSTGTLSRWRWLDKGPKYYKIYTKVRYKHSDLEEFLNGGERVPTDTGSDT